jgi:hypothetical protein
MHGARAWVSIPVLLCTGCPETWGINGTMDRALRKDIEQMGRHDACPLSDPAEREYRCAIPSQRDRRGCPTECRP